MGKSFANREVADLMFVEYSTKKPFMNFELANTTGYDLEGDTVFAYGGQGHPKRVSFSGNRSGTFRVETQMQTMKLYQMITGADLKADAQFLQREVVKAGGASNKELTIQKTPIDGSVHVYKTSDDCGTEVKATTAATKVTLETAGAAGDEYIVYYLTKLEGVNRLNINTRSFPKAFTIYGETYEKTEDDEIVPYRMIAYKAVPQPSFSVDFANDGDPTSLSITFDLLADNDDNVLDLLLEE